ncbi:hypothetical protein ABE19_24080 [Bacillus toyonensis]|nr:hypothetical protein AT259_11115 [Bacillus cereus]MBG9607709.1 hypothetical protein [Bacillus toyonensis]MBG9845632.1 hypothetical protein [Bacillus toyonensis]MBG9851535.1 hypothetical protein [Bacillus toyonensis]MBG9870776.1 hypothetical protein [Bacillus toyonensis]
MDRFTIKVKKKILVYKKVGNSLLNNGITDLFVNRGNFFTNIIRAIRNDKKHLYISFLYSVYSLPFFINKIKK